MAGRVRNGYIDLYQTTTKHSEVHTMHLCHLILKTYHETYYWNIFWREASYFLLHCKLIQSPGMQSKLSSLKGFWFRSHVTVGIDNLELKQWKQTSMCAIVNYCLNTLRPEEKNLQTIWLIELLSIKLITSYKLGFALFCSTNLFIQWV